MKTYKNLLIVRLGVVIALFSALYSAHITSMVSKQSPAQKHVLAAKIALLKKIAPIWVQVSDNETIAVDSWKINQLNELKSLLSSQQGKNSKANPLKAPINKNELTLLSTALDKIKKGEFDTYYASLEPEYKKSLTDKNIGPGQLRTLITAAGKVKATELTALLSSYFLPHDMLKKEMIPQVVAPIVQYLTSEMIKRDIFYPTTLEGHPDEITNCEFSKNGAIVVTSSKGTTNNLIIWDGQTGKQLRAITVANGIVDLVKPNPDGSKVITLSSKKIDESKEIDAPNNKKDTTILWNTKTGKEIKILDIPENLVSYNIQFNFDGTRIVIGSQTEDITVADINAPEEKTFIYILDGNTGNTIVKHDIINNYPSPTVNPKGNTMVIRSAENLFLYDLTTGKMIKQLEGPTEKIYDPSYNMDGTKITANNYSTNIAFVWSGTTGEKLAEFNNITYPMNLNTNGTKIAAAEFTANNNFVVNIWNVATQEKIKTLQSATPFNNVYNVKFSSDDNMILAATDVGIILWNSVTEEESKILTLYSSSYYEAIFSSDNKRIQSHQFPAENEENCTVIFWDIAKESQIKTFMEPHDLLEQTEDFLNVISPDPDNNHNFILWTPLSLEERTALKIIENNLNLNQAHFLYQLYIAKKSNSPLSTENNKQFETFPIDTKIIIWHYLSNPPLTMQPTSPQLEAARAFKEAEREIPPVAKPLQRAIKEPEIIPTQPEKTPTKTWWQWFTGQ